MTGHRPELYRDDPILGTERRCRDCGEWWPLDSEFWFFQTRVSRWTGRTSTIPYSYCKACWFERGRSAFPNARKSA